MRSLKPSAEVVEVAVEAVLRGVAQVSIDRAVPAQDRRETGLLSHRIDRVQVSRGARPLDVQQARLQTEPVRAKIVAARLQIEPTRAKIEAAHPQDVVVQLEPTTDTRVPLEMLVDTATSTGIAPGDQHATAPVIDTAASTDTPDIDVTFAGAIIVTGDIAIGIMDSGSDVSSSVRQRGW